MKLDDKLEKIKGIYSLGTGDIEYLNVSAEHDNLMLNLQSGSVSFQAITHYLNMMGLSSVTLRVPQLIDKQLGKLYDAFSNSFKKFNYPSKYRGVFPVKVNHNASVLKSISMYGANYGHGFEVGTKPELLIVLSLKHDPSSLIVCNGSKDDDYIDAALTLTEKGYNIIISIESLREIKDLIRISQRRQIIPQIGLRIKMNQSVEGHWGHSSGLYSKFGLSASELVETINILKDTNYLEFVKLLHGHLGSQINKANYFKRSVTELIGYYQNLFSLGAIGLRFINLGGGLGIDYEGNNFATDSGINYSFENYADTIVSTIIDCLKENHEIIPPDIITESGRAITATSSMMLVEILENRSILPEINQIYSTNEIDKLEKDLFMDLLKCKSLKAFEIFLTNFNKTIVELQSVKSFWTNFKSQRDIEVLIASMNKLVLTKVKKLFMKKEKYFEIDIEKLFPRIYSLLTKYTNDLVGNFSVFRGACDAVLAHQYFPILPTQGLHSTPKTLVRLVDITCDSDGELVRFVSKTAFKNRISCKNSDYFTKDGQLLAHPSEVLQINGIPLPEKNTKVGSYVVVALTGAYQDTVQFDQNLLGALPEVEVVIDTLGHTQFKILSYAESNSNLIADMKHNLHTIDALEHLLFSNPYVNNKSPSSTIRPAEILESSKSPQIKQTFTESKQMNVN